MAMGRRRDRAPSPGLWIATNDLPATGGDPFYRRLNQILDAHGCDAFVEDQCAAFYATGGRPSLASGLYVRPLLIAYFEGLDSERGIAWRAADSLALRRFLGLGFADAPPDHSTISRTGRLIDLETHQAVFTWVLQVLAGAGLVCGKTIGVDATTLEANAALRSIVRRDTGETYQAFLTQLAQTSGIATPTRADLARVDRKRPKKGSGTDWTHPHDPDARITKMKDGRTHLAHKAEHAVHMETGAVVAVTLHGADQGHTTTIQETVPEAAEQKVAMTHATKRVYRSVIHLLEESTRFARRGRSNASCAIDSASGASCFADRHSLPAPRLRHCSTDEPPEHLEGMKALRVQRPREAKAECALLSRPTVRRLSAIRSQVAGFHIRI